MSEDKGLSSRAVIGSFYRRLEAVSGESWTSAVSMLITSDQAAEEYTWLGFPPAMREWIGGRQGKGLRENGIVIRNKHFESSIHIPRRWLRRDKTGQLDVRIGELAERVVTHRASLLSTLIAAGETALCYDGEAFFDTDHEEGDSGAQSNDIAVDISTVPGAGTDDTPSAPSPIQMQHAIMASVEAILGFKDDVGEPMNEQARQFLVMVPTPLFKAAAAALRNPMVNGGETNILTNLDGYTFGLAVNPRLSWTDKVAVFRTDGSARPLIFQQETDPVMTAIAEGSEYEALNDAHLYGVDYWGNCGYGYWQHACLATLT